MFSKLFFLVLFTPAAIVAALTLVLLRLRPPGKPARGFPVVLSRQKTESPAPENQKG
jgi:hypothetical protein